MSVLAFVNATSLVTHKADSLLGRFILSMRLFGLAAMCASLLACATVLEPSLNAGPKDGNVVLSLSSNMGGHIPRYITVVLISRQGSQLISYSLKNPEPRSSIDRDTKLFIGAVPAGNYTINYFDAFNSRLYLSQITSEAHEFRVEVGKTSDLGRLVAVQDQDSNLISLVRTPISSNRQLVSDLPADWRNLLNFPLSDPWVRPIDRELDNLQSYKVQGLTGMSTDSDTLYFGARLGAVVKRDKSGTWRLLGRSPELLSVLSTVAEADGSIVAAGEFGSLFRVSPNGNVTTLDTGNLPPGDIVFIDHSPDEQQWLVAVQSSKKLSVLLGSQVDGGDWEERWSVPYKWDLWKQLSPLTAWRNSKGITVVSTVGSTVSCYNWAEKSWKTHGSPNGAFLGVSRGTGDAFGVRTSGGFYGETHVSEDCGQTWTELNKPHSFQATEAVPFRFGDNYIATEGDTFGSATATFISTDAGKTWQKTSDRSVEPTNVWYVPQHNLLFAVSTVREMIRLPYGAPGQEQILISKDGGRTWDIDLK